MANLEDRGRKPEEKFREGFASEAGCRAAKRRSSGLRLLSVVGTLALTVICSAGTPVAARGRGATLPGEGSPGDIYTNATYGDNYVTVGTSGNHPDTQVAHVSVPAGNYVVHVSMNVVNPNLQIVNLACYLAQSPSRIVFWMFVPPTIIDTQVTLSFTDIAALSSAGTVAALCSTDVAPVNVQPRLTAILGGTLHQQ